jgi:hypothetical protein
MTVEQKPLPAELIEKSITASSAPLKFRIVIISMLAKYLSRFIRPIGRPERSESRRMFGRKTCRADRFAHRTLRAELAEMRVAKFAKVDIETQALAGSFEHFWLEMPVDTGVSGGAPPIRTVIPSVAKESTFRCAPRRLNKVQKLEGGLSEANSAEC